MIPFQTQQILIPKSVYIGDSAELRCTFKCDKELPSDISTECFTSPLDFNKFEVRNITLHKAGPNTYSLVVSFIPWRTGNIQFPEIEIKNVNADGSFSQAEGLIHFDPVMIHSLVEEKNVTSLKDSASPLLLPGTAYKIYGGIILAVIVLIVSINLILRRKKVSAFFKNRKIMRKNAKNKKLTVKALKELAKNQEMNSQNKAQSIQQIMRKYLETRFEYPFSRTLTSEMLFGFESIFAENQEVYADSYQSFPKIDSARDIISIFQRTDVIRYRAEEEFEDTEAELMIARLIDDIEVLEIVPKIPEDAIEILQMKESEHA